MIWINKVVHVIPGANGSTRDIQAVGNRDDSTTWYVTERIYNGKVENARSRALAALDDFLDAPAPTEAR